MALTRKTISFTDQHDEWIKSQIDSGNYANESEYIRDLIRRDQQEKERNKQDHSMAVPDKPSEIATERKNSA